MTEHDTGSNTRQKRIAEAKRIISFGAIGALMTLASQGIYMLLAGTTHLAPALCSVISDLVTITASYFLHCRFTWKLKPSWRGMLIYPIAYLPGTLIGMGITSCVCCLGMQKMFAKLTALPVTTTVNYLMTRMAARKTAARDHDSKSR